jgi:hypothetical protein
LERRRAFSAPHRIAAFFSVAISLIWFPYFAIADSESTKLSKNSGPQLAKSEPALEDVSDPQARCKRKVPRKDRSDRSEPQYVGMSGFICPDPRDRPTGYSESLPKTPWIIPLLEQVGPHLWGTGTKTIPAQTAVTVLEQYLHHRGAGLYQGFLKVHCVADDKIVYIMHRNFAATDYWNCPAHTAIEHSYFIAEIIDSSHRLVTDKGRWLDIPHSNRTFCTGRTYNRSVPDELECIIYTNREGYKCHLPSTVLRVLE